jgi:hydroxypyruvate reductase
VRKHVSAVKGGRLAQAAHPARVVTYLISDVPGDDPAVIASGPTVLDPTTFAEALETLQRYDLDVPPIATHLRAGAGRDGGPADRPPETPKPGDPSFAGDEVVMLATAKDALEAAALRARAAGLNPVMLGDDLQGEARDLAGAHAELAVTCAAGHEQSLIGLREAVARDAAHLAGPPLPVQRPLVLLSGGETTVTVRGPGRGGRNSEYLLALGLALGGHPGIGAIACDTDGVDGVEEAAGAILTADTLERAELVGADPVAALEENDSYSVFAALGDLVVTGPTGTNVNDFRAILVV